MIEPADQAAQRRIGHRFVPVVEDGSERLLLRKGRQHRAQDGRHPQQGRQLLSKPMLPNAAKIIRTIIRTQKRMIT